MRPAVVLITGLSGAGRSTCLAALEDIGYTAVDNIPARLLPALLASHQQEGGAALAVGLDSRTHNLLDAETIAFLQQQKNTRPHPMHLLFLECSDAVLQRRFITTRRRHPLAEKGRLDVCIQAERALLAPLKAMADTVYDTATVLPARLKLWLTHTYGDPQKKVPVIHVLSFSYKKSLPSEADIVMDMRFLENPFYDESLRAQTGCDADVQAFIRRQPAWQAFIDGFWPLLLTMLAGYAREGRACLTLAFGCTGGQHRSVMAAEHMAGALTGDGWQTHLWHQDMQL